MKLHFVRRQSSAELGISFAILLTCIVHSPQAVGQSLEETLDFIFTGQEYPTRENGWVRTTIIENTKDFGEIKSNYWYRILGGCKVELGSDESRSKVPGDNYDKYHLEFTRIDMSRVKSWRVDPKIRNYGQYGPSDHSYIDIGLQGLDGMFCQKLASGNEFVDPRKTDTSRIVCENYGKYVLNSPTPFGQGVPERLEKALVHLSTGCKPRAF